MAPKTFHLLQTLAPGGNHHALQEGGNAPSAQTLTTGWIVGTIEAGKYSRMETNVERPTSAHTATIEPDGLPDPQIGDCFRSHSSLTGSFVAGSWTFAVPVRGTRRETSTHDGNLRLRVWRSTDPTGGNAIQISPGTLVSSGYVNLSNSTDQVCSLTWQAPAFTLQNEYLFVQVAHEIQKPGDSPESNTHLRIGPPGKIETADFDLATRTSPSVPDHLLRLIIAVATSLGVVGFTTLVGGAVMWISFRSALVPANLAVSVKPEVELLIAGAATLIPFLLLALFVVFVAYFVNLKWKSNAYIEIVLTWLVVGVAAFFLQDVGWTSYLVLLFVGTGLVLLSHHVGSRTEGFGWFGIMIFISVFVFAAAAGIARAISEPKLQGAAVLRKGDEAGMLGFYVGESSDRVYLGRVDVKCDGSKQKGDPAVSRVVAIPRSELLGISVGPWQAPCNAIAHSNDLLDELHHDVNIPKRPVTTITAGPHVGPSTDGPRVSISFKGRDNVTKQEDIIFECNLDGEGFRFCASPMTLIDLEVGNHSIAVRAVDAEGNTDPSPAVRSWIVEETAGSWLSYRQLTVKRLMMTFRAYGGDASRVGRWAAPKRPPNRHTARAGLALPPSNSARCVVRVTIPPGTRIRRGFAGPHFGLPGGRGQIQILGRLKDHWYSEGKPLSPYTGRCPR